MAPLDTISAQGKLGFAWDSDTGDSSQCHHCCVTLNYSQEMGLIPSWCQAGITQLLWKLWLIHFAQARQAEQISEGHQVTWTLLPRTCATAGCPQ